MSESSALLVRDDGPVRHLVLNRPDKLNALGLDQHVRTKPQWCPSPTSAKPWTGQRRARRARAWRLSRRGGYPHGGQAVLAQLGSFGRSCLRHDQGAHLGFRRSCLRAHGLPVLTPNTAKAGQPQQPPVLLDDEQVREFITNGFLRLTPDVPAQVHAEVDALLRHACERETWYGNNILARVPKMHVVLDCPVVRGAVFSLAGEGFHLHPHRAVHSSTPANVADSALRSNHGRAPMGKGSRAGSGWHQDAESPLSRARGSKVGKRLQQRSWSRRIKKRKITPCKKVGSHPPPPPRMHNGRHARCLALALASASTRFAPRSMPPARARHNRSILGDARSPAMQKTLNLKVKHRESFRPFAPSEVVADWFALDRDSSYMLLVAAVKPERRKTLVEAQERCSASTV